MTELTTQSKSTAPIKSLGDLDLSDFKSLIEQAKQSNTSLALSEDFGQEGGNPLWRAHVNAWLGKSDRITWSYPITSEERKKLEAAGEIYEEVSSSAPEHHFVGVRGLILKVAYGRKLTIPDPDKANSFTTICHTTALENTMTGHTVTDRMPMEIPLSQIYHNKDNPHEVTPWLKERPYLKLYGSRPPVGMGDDVKTTQVRSCEECVMAGEHYAGTLEDFLNKDKSVPKCSLDGYMLFCVFQMGLLDSTQVLRGGKSQIKWVDVKDAQLTKQLPDGTLEPRTAPFILKINGLSAVQHRYLGTGNFQREIITSGKNCYLPEGASLHSWGEYFNKYLHARNVTGDPRAIDIEGTTVYPVVTDLMMAKLRNDEFQATHLPVYAPVKDPDVITRGEGLNQFDWLLQALQALQWEEALVKGEVLSGSPSGLPGKTPTAEIAPAESNSMKDIAEASEEVVDTPPKSKFAAFAPPPEVK